jgi:uncharacterized protein (DUF697 family)
VYSLVPETHGLVFGELDAPVLAVHVVVEPTGHRHPRECGDRTVRVQHGHGVGHGADHVSVGIDISEAALVTTIGSALLTSSASFMGREIVGNVLNLIPGTGRIAGSALNAGVAGTVTTAVDTAWTAVIQQLADTPHKVASMSAADIRKAFETSSARRRTGQRTAATTAYRAGHDSLRIAATCRDPRGLLTAFLLETWQEGLLRELVTRWGRLTSRTFGATNLVLLLGVDRYVPARSPGPISVAR